MPQDQLSQQAEAALKATYLLIGDNQLQGKLLDEERANAALDELRLPAGARTRLLDIINKLNSQQGAHVEGPLRRETATLGVSEVERILLESFLHIRWSFWVSIVMSVVLFLVGVVFLGTVLVQSLRADGVSTSTLTMAGVGIADLVVLFYSRPWKDVATNLANSQRIRMIATSYLASFPLIHGGGEQMKALAELTDRSVRLIQDSLEKQPPSSEKS